MQSATMAELASAEPITGLPVAKLTIAKLKGSPTVTKATLLKRLESLGLGGESWLKGKSRDELIEQYLRVLTGQNAEASLPSTSKRKAVARRATKQPKAAPAKTPESLDSNLASGGDIKGRGGGNTDSGGGWGWPNVARAACNTFSVVGAWRGSQKAERARMAQGGSNHDQSSRSRCGSSTGGQVNRVPYMRRYQRTRSMSSGASW